MDAPRFTLICCSVDPAAAEALRRNVAATIGEPFEFDVWDNRGRNVGLCDVYDRCAEAYFLKLLCQKRLFGACPFRRIVRYIRAYPGRAASWALPFKYLKYHVNSLVRHG